MACVVLPLLSTKWCYLLNTSIIIVILMFTTLITADQNQAETSPDNPTPGLQCISKCGTCPVICSPPPSPPTESTSPPTESSSPPSPPTESSSPPSPPQSLPLPPAILPYTPPSTSYPSPPSQPPPSPKSTSPPSSSSQSSKGSNSPPPAGGNAPYLSMSGPDQTPDGDGQPSGNYHYPYYYFYDDSKASSILSLSGYFFSCSVSLLVFGFCS